jgi:hypothetical protein
MNDPLLFWCALIAQAFFSQDAAALKRCRVLVDVCHRKRRSWYVNMVRVELAHVKNVHTPLVKLFIGVCIFALSQVHKLTRSLVQ